MSYWQFRCAEMKQRSAYLYQSGLWSDCSFRVGEEEVIVKAHRLIVAMASPVFGKLFYGREAAKNPVPIYDTRPEVFRILLEYIYSDHINLTNLRDACDLHNAAFKWRLPYVKEMCIKFISSSLNADNVICIYELACQSNEFHLQDDCIKIFKTLTKEILKAESLKEAKLSTVLKIFSMDTLNIDSELDLFKAAVNHAAAQEVEDGALKRTLDRCEDCFTPANGPSSVKRSRIYSTGLDNAVEIELQQNEREKQAGTTRITVNNIRKLKKFESNPFYIRNLAWTLMLLQIEETVDDINRDILIIAVTCFFEKGVPEWIEKVEVRVSFISEIYVGNRFQDMKLKLSQPCNDYGAWLIKKEWSDLMSAHGIIEDNTVTCKVHVSTNIQKSPTSPDSSPDNTQTDYITTPLRSSTPVSRARYLKEKTQKHSDLTASGLAETRSQTPRLPEKRSLTPLLPEKRSLTPLLSEKCSVPSPLIEKRSLTSLLSEKRSVSPSPLTEKRSLTPQLPEKSNQSVLLDRSLTPPNKRLPPVLSENRSRFPLIEKHGVAKTPGKRNLSPLPEERDITPPPVENRSLPPRPKKRYLTQSPTEKLAGSPEKISLNSSPFETSNLPSKNGATSSLLPNNKATPSLPEKHVSTQKPLLINTKSPISSQATLTQSIPASISSPSLPAVPMRPKQTGNNTVCSQQTLNSPGVGPINLNSSDTSIETLKLTVSNKDKPRALTCVQILRSLHRKGYPMNGSIAQRYLNELSAMSINGFHVLRPLLAYANASAATNGSGHIVPAIMDKKQDVVSSMNSANSASRSIDDINSKSVTKPDQKGSEPVISEPIPGKDNAFVSESMAIVDDIAIPDPSALTDCTDSVNEQNMKQLAPKPLALKDGQSTSEPIPIKDTNSCVSTPMAIPVDITSISSPSVLTDSTDPISEKNMKQLTPKPLAIKDDGPSISEPIPMKDTSSSVSKPYTLTDVDKVLANTSALIDGADSIKEKDLKQQAPKTLTLKDNKPLISEAIPKKDNVTTLTVPMAITDDVEVISKPSPLNNGADSTKEKDMKQLASKPHGPKDNETSISEPILMEDTISSISEPMAITDNITAITNPSAFTDCTDSVNENNMKQHEPIPIRDTNSSVSESIAITDDITGISSPSTLASIPHAPKDNEPSISETIPIKDSSVIEPLTTTDDLNSAFKPSIIAASSISDPLPLKSLTLLHSKVSIENTLIEQVHPKSPVTVISETMHLNKGVSLSENVAFNDDFEVPSEPSAPMKFTDSANEKDMEQLTPNPLPLMDNEPLILEPMCLEEPDDTNAVSELSSFKIAPNMSVKLEAESSIIDRTRIILEQSPDEKNKEQTTLKTLALRAIPLVSDSNLKENTPTVPQSLDSSVNDESVLKLSASNNNSSSMSDSRSLKYDDSETSELFDLIDSADSSLKRDSIENPLDVKKYTASCISKPLAGDNISPTPMDLMESVDIHPEPHTVEAKLTLGDTEPSKSEPVALNDTILLNSKPVTVPLLSNPLVLDDNLTSTSKQMDLMETIDTNSESEEIPSVFNDTIPLESKPVAIKHKDARISESLNQNVPSVSDTLALDYTVPLVSTSLAPNDNISNQIESDSSIVGDPLAPMETAPLKSEPPSAPNATIPSETKQVSLSNALTLSVSDPLALSDTIPSVSNTLALNDNLSSAAKPIYLKSTADANPESHSVDNRLTLGVTEPSKSDPLPPIYTIPSESKPVLLNKGPTLSKPLVWKDNVTTLSKPLCFIEDVPSALDSSVSNANTASESMDITDSNIEPLTTEVSLTQSDIARKIPETIELIENSPSVSEDIALLSYSGITCMSAFDDKDSSLSSEAILKCRRTLMTLKQLKYPMSGTLAQKYLKTLKELTDKYGINVTTNLVPKSKPSTLKNKTSMSEEAKVDESKQTLILINRQILMSLKSLKYPMSGPIARKHMKALLDLTNKTQQLRPHLKSTEISHSAPRSKQNSAASSMSEMKKAFIIRKIIKYKRALMTLKFHKYPMTGFMAQKYIKAIDDLKKKIDL